MRPLILSFSLSLAPFLALPIIIAAPAPARAAEPAPKLVELREIHGQLSHVIATEQTELAVTLLGGHMAPVTFYRDSTRPIQPYHISPWQDERPPEVPVPVLGPLRGDFFCLPFGGNTEEVGGEKHPPHGEIAGSPWHLVGAKKSGPVTTLTLSFETKIRPGRITKELSLVEEQDVVYSRHVIEGMTGRMPLGHHATLAMPATDGAVRFATSRFRFGLTCPGLFSNPQEGEYQALLPGAKWSDLTKVPAAWKTAADADLTRLPGRPGFADLVQIVHESWNTTGGPAWTTATFSEEGWLWFALKDADVLNSTVIWMENHGRHGHPWNGRNNCVGLEDVTACFADGLAAAGRENALTREQVATTIELKAGQTTAVNYIQGVIKVPASFENVQTVEFAPGKVTFISLQGKRVTASVHHEFLRTGKL
jgi:hypothetical protein